MFAKSTLAALALIAASLAFSTTNAFAWGYGHDDSGYNSDNGGYHERHCYRQPVWGWNSYGQKVIVDYRETCE